MRRSSRDPISAKTVLLNAVALQDHFSRLFQVPGRLPLPSSLTLAQRLKLVAGPTVLSAQQWEAAHTQSLARGDSKHECSICLQPFREEPQVLLSCSHSFHQQCLAAFECFSSQHCCPLCRCQAYQKKKIQDGARFYREQCATRIQATFRGHRARKQFRALRDLVPPQHPSLRRRWVAEKLHCRTERLLESTVRAGAGCGEIDALFAELEATERQARLVYTQLEARCPGSTTATAVSAGQQPAVARGFATAAAAGGWGPGRARASAPAATAGAAGSKAVPAVDWEEVVRRALEREEDPECSICLAPLVRQLQPEGNGESSQARDSGEEQGQQRQQQQQQQQQQQPVSGGGIAVLSCSHAFHCDCLALFEAFQFANEAAPRCPCCRAHYARIQLK